MVSQQIGAATQLNGSNTLDVIAALTAAARSLASTAQQLGGIIDYRTLALAVANEKVVASVLINIPDANPEPEQASDA